MQDVFGAIDTKAHDFFRFHQASVGLFEFRLAPIGQTNLQTCRVELEKLKLLGSVECAAIRERKSHTKSGADAALRHGLVVCSRS